MRMHIIFLVLVPYLLTASCKKDLLHWQKVQQLNSNASCRLNHIKFIDNHVCLIAGGVQFQQSEILRSVDGGYTWSAGNNSDAPKEMYGLSISLVGDIYLCGIDGDVLLSKDLGRTWQFHRINNWEVYTGGSFMTPDTGIFVSTVLQRQCSFVRVDSNFNIIDENTLAFGLNDFYRIDANTAYAVGYGAVMKTTDRGNTWHFQNVQGDDFMAMDIHGDEIWMCGSNGSIYHTVNGGDGWGLLRNGNDITIPHYGLRSIVFKDALHGWAAGDDGKVIFTDDGGNHWEEFNQFTTSNLRSIVLCPNGDLLVAGDNGVLFRMIP